MRSQESSTDREDMAEFYEPLCLGNIVAVYHRQRFSC